MMTTLLMLCNTERRNRSIWIPELYINRELSMLEFNYRVLEEALDPTVPLLERVKFLAIFANNLDEFFMIRVSGLREQVAAGVVETPADGLTPAQQLAAIRKRLLPMLDLQYRCYREEILPQLRQDNISAGALRRTAG